MPKSDQIDETVFDEDFVAKAMMFVDDYKHKDKDLAKFLRRMIKKLVKLENAMNARIRLCEQQVRISLRDEE
jgi:hypothetical protein